MIVSNEEGTKQTATLLEEFFSGYQNQKDGGGCQKHPSLEKYKLEDKTIKAMRISS